MGPIADSVVVMEHIRWSAEPTPQPSILIAAFDGWNDAGEAATASIDWLSTRFGAEPLADIDPEEFFDFTATRPIVRIIEGDQRQLDWPSNDFEHTAEGPSGKGLVLLRGTEPGLRWRTFCEQILAVIDAAQVDLVISLGALLADVPHTRPPTVVGTSPDGPLSEALGLETSSYEGPTGVIGALHDACRNAGVPSASLWATVPSYVSASPSPKAQLALLERLAVLLEESFMMTDLEIASSAYERQVNELVGDDPDTLEYVAAMEERHDAEIADTSPDSLEDFVTEVEDFLKGEA